MYIYKPARERLRTKRKHKIIKQQHTVLLSRITHTRRHRDAAHQEFFFRILFGHVSISRLRRGRVPVSRVRVAFARWRKVVNAPLHNKKKVVALSAGDCSKFTHHAEHHTRAVNVSRIISEKAEERERERSCRACASRSTCRRRRRTKICCRITTHPRWC